MFKTRFVLLFAFLQVVLCVSNTTICVDDAKHIKVTIFEGTANVERLFQVPIQFFEQERHFTIILNKISRHMQPKSISVKLQDFEDVQIVHFSTAKYSAVTRDAQFVDFEANVTQANAQIAKINTHMERFKKVNTFLENSIYSFSQGDANTIKEKLHLFLTQTEANHEKLFEYEAQVEELKAKVREWEKLMEVPEHVEFYSQISVHVVANSNVKPGLHMIPLVVTYSVTEASWSPYYAMRLDSAKAQGTIEFGTKIKQDTGENWTNVTVALSNTLPITADNPPTALIKTVKLIEKNAKGWKSINDFVLYTVTDTLTSDHDQVRSTQSQLTNIVTFAMKNPLQLPSHSEEQRATVEIKSISNVVFEHFAIPSMRGNQVFLRARVKNPSSLPLLSSAVDVFIDQQYISHTHLVGKYFQGAIQPNEEFELFLGVDHNVALNAKETTVENEFAFLGFNGKMVTTKTSVFIIDNRKSIPINITIIEGIPQPQSKELHLFLDKPQFTMEQQNSKSTDVVTLLASHFGDIQVNEFVIAATKQEYTTLNRDYVWKSNIALDANSKYQTALEFRLEHPKSTSMSLSSRL